MAIFISSTASNANRSLHGLLQKDSGQNLSYVKDVYRYQILYTQVIQLMNSYITYFTSGDFDGLRNNFNSSLNAQLQLYLKNNESFYNQNIEDLVGFKYDPNMFIRYRNSTFKTLDGLMQSITLYNKFEQSTIEVQRMSTILSTRDNIIQYLNENSMMTSIAFRTSQSVNLDLVLKPWYEQYLIQYGPPNDGVFQATLLAEIATNLINEGVITQEQFIQDRYP
jgi:hypothetical protein